MRTQTHAARRWGLLNLLLHHHRLRERARLASTTRRRAIRLGTVANLFRVCDERASDVLHTHTPNNKRAVINTLNALRSRLALV